MAATIDAGPIHVHLRIAFKRSAAHCHVDEAVRWIGPVLRVEELEKAPVKFPATNVRI